MARDVYTHGHHDAVLRSHRWRTAENSTAYLLPHLVNGQRLLDVGCGPGTLTVDLARQVAPGEVVGIDVAESVVTEASAYAEGAAVANVRFLSGDFRQAGLELGSFDVVHAHQVLQHLSDPVGALATMALLARPGGIVAVRDADYSAFTWAPASPGLDRWLEIYLAVTRRNGAEANAGRHLLAWAHAAELGGAVYSTSTWTYATPPDRQWWAELWAERSVSSSFAHQAVEYGAATEAELAEVAAAWRGWAADEDAVFVVPHGEVIARVGAP
jgi:2-polyprenyl-3-methyl-5-hydroxy-6-metoxy-1,4-benzoquinol methylase